MTLAPAPESAADDLNVDNWIQESFDAAKQTAYKSPPIGPGNGSFTLTLAYKTAARNLAEKRIALAGMVNIAFQLVVLLAWLTQLSTTVTLRTGDVARQLTEQDVAALELVLPSGAKPWLLNGDRAYRPNIQYIEAYLSPTTATSTLRRGSVIAVTRQIAPRTDWTVEWSVSYAQVAIPGRNFDQIEGDQDINRPFRVIGRFDDTELVQLVELLRSNPPIRGVGPGPHAIQSWPILSIDRKFMGDTVEVLLRGGVMQGQYITLRQAGQDWVIVSAGLWVA